jgi:hypothetical protein
MEKLVCSHLIQAAAMVALGLRGILAIIFGLICLLTPGIAVGASVIVFAPYILEGVVECHRHSLASDYARRAGSGALMFAAAFSLNLDYGRWWLADDSVRGRFGQTS